ncbi:ATP synthase subunit gamma, mitochondrial [Cichlidogyrus casuarinus]|uniref:ATP synthase subunit gamma n=1 Tax=Cichlidogyrus casuarinus TaxID=1844966 RepID=A0ABD2Q9M5_9PLAT
MFIGKIGATNTLATQARSFATLKDISVRLKSVKNIQKITASMKMVSAAKFNKAERELKPAKPYGLGASSFYVAAEIPKEESPGLFIAVTSDRGLCGAANSSIAKAIREMKTKPENKDTKIVLIGDKSRAMLSRLHRNQFVLSFNEVGRKPATFADASIIAQNLMALDNKFDQATLFYNKFQSVVSYSTTQQPIFSQEKIMSSEKVALYDDVDDESMRSYNEFLLTSLIYYALKEASCSEQSARMTAMDSATKNAGEMIGKLQLSFNRTRQAAITRELTEIISGAAAV